MTTKEMDAWNHIKQLWLNFWPTWKTTTFYSKYDRQVQKSWISDEPEIPIIKLLFLESLGDVSEKHGK